MHEFPCGSCYIGRTMQAPYTRRFGDSLNSFKDAYHNNPIFINHLNKYGKPKTFVLVDGLSLDETLIFEPEFIKELNTFNKDNPDGLNLTPGGDGFGYGDTHTNSKLSMDDVAHIEDLLKNTDLFYHEISNFFLIKDPLINQINKGEHWASTNKWSYPLRHIATDLSKEEFDIIEYELINTIKPFKDIAKDYNRTDTLISHINVGIHPFSDKNNFNYPLRKRSKPGKLLTKDEFDQIEFDLINTSLTITELAIKHNRNTNLIQKVKRGEHRLCDENKTEYPIGRKKRLLTKEEVNNIEYDLENNNYLYIEDLMDKYNRGKSTIYLINNGIHKLSDKTNSKYPITKLKTLSNNVKSKHPTSLKDKEDMVFLYYAGIFSIPQAADLYNYHQGNLGHIINGELVKKIDLSSIQDKAEVFAMKYNIWY